MINPVDISSFIGYRVCQVETGTIITDPLGKAPDVTVDDNNVAVRGCTMFVTRKVFEGLQEAIPEKRP